MAPDPPAPPAGEPEPPSPLRQRPPPLAERFPWREAGLAAGLVLLGWPVALLAFVLPFAAYVAALRRGPARAAGLALAAAIPALLVALVPGAEFFLVAAGLATAAAVVALRRLRRVGYPELSACVLAGIGAASLAWLVVDPGFFERLRDALEEATLAQGRVWLARLEAAGDPATRAELDRVLRASAALAARSWPAAVFAALWTGSAAALAFATRGAASARAPGGPVRVRERCSRFRLPDLWLWVLLAGAAGFLAAPGPGAVQDAALNLALVALGLFAWQGLAVALYFLERRGVGAAGRVLLLGSGFLLLWLPLFLAALAVGLADMWLDLRSRAPDGPPVPPPV